MDCLADPSIRDDASGKSPSRRLRILIVDNDLECAVSTRLLCKLWGYDARQCRDGEDALKMLTGYLPDVFLLDTAMPGTCGFELATRLRELPSYSDALLIALSACADDADRARALVAGFDYYVTKPADSAILRQLLHEEACPLCDLIAWGVALA
jgi:CheY-like chemotaxis protein